MAIESAGPGPADEGPDPLGDADPVTWVDQILQGLFGLGLGSLCFMAGAILVSLKLPPYDLLQEAREGAAALYVRHKVATARERGELGESPKGVVTWDREATQDGLTLYCSSQLQGAVLIDMDGTEVHRWEKAFFDVWEDPPHIDEPTDPERIEMEMAHVFPNGDLLAIYYGSNDTPAGYGMVKLDVDSNLLWSYAEHTHHRFSVGPDGKIYALIHDFSFDLPDPRLPDDVLEDYVVVLSPDGEELDRFSLVEALQNSPFSALYRPYVRLQTCPGREGWDLLHGNDIDLITPELAAAHPYARPGQLLVSARNLGALLVVDIQERRVTEVLRGPWLAQHDPDLLPDGTVLVYDNLNGQVPLGLSRIIAVDPETSAIRWSYEGTKEDPFASDVGGAVQRLPNGNTLITESVPPYTAEGGTLLEVTQEGELVWQFRNPIPARIHAAHRYPRSALPFLGGRATGSPGAGP